MTFWWFNKFQNLLRNQIPGETESVHTWQRQLSTATTQQHMLWLADLCYYSWCPLRPWSLAAFKEGYVSGFLHLRESHHIRVVEEAWTPHSQRDFLVRGGSDLTKFHMADRGPCCGWPLDRIFPNLGVLILFCNFWVLRSWVCDVNNVFKKRYLDNNF